MLTYILASLIHGFKRTWKLYLTNTLSFVIMILLLAYLDGSRRQLNLQNTVYSGDISVTLVSNIQAADTTLASAIPGLQLVSRKVSAPFLYLAPGSGKRGEAVVSGADFSKELKLKAFLSLKEGRLPQSDSEILIPESLAEQAATGRGETLVLSGTTFQRTYQSRAYQVCGVYSSSALSVSSLPRLLVTPQSMESLASPGFSDIRYCLYFKDGVKPPANINQQIARALGDRKRNIIKAIEAHAVSAYDVLNISVQFNVFLVIIILLTIVVIISVVIIVNFNIYTILFRRRNRETGTLMAFGTHPAKIALLIFLEHTAQLLLCLAASVVLCLVTAQIFRSAAVGGFFEVLFVLLSGTNRLDFYIRPYQVVTSFLIIFTAVTLSQLPVILRIVLTNPIVFMNKR